MATSRRIRGIIIGMALVAAACAGAGPTAPAPGTGATRTAPPSAAASAPATPAPATPTPATPTPSTPEPSSTPGADLPTGLPPSPLAVVAARVSDGRSSLLLADASGARTLVPVSGVPSGEVAARPGSDEVALPVTVCETADQPCGTIIVDVDVVSGSERRLTPFASGANDTSPAWSPDGSRLVFASSRKGDPYGWELYLVPAAGGDAVLLETGLRISQAPAWSPDGDTIAFVGSGDDSRTGLYLVGAGGGPARKLIDLDGSTPLAWSPDGTRIAYQATNSVETAPNEFTGFASIAVVELAGGDATVVRATPSMNRSPAWSPDGTAIGFILEEPGLPGRLTLMDPDGRNVHLLGTADWVDAGFAWLP